MELTLTCVQRLLRPSNEEYGNPPSHPPASFNDADFTENVKTLPSAEKSVNTESKSRSQWKNALLKLHF